MLEHNPVARRLIAEALGNVVDRTVRKHVAGITQEPALTARIGQALENELDGRPILGYRLRIFTQDIPDRGTGSLERYIGGDLYVEVGEGAWRESKGFLVQAKFERNLIRHSAERQALREDCEDMLDRTTASYVWLYSDNRVRVLKAQQVRDSPEDPQSLPARRASTLFDRTLECREGARALGLPDVQGDEAHMRSALGTLLEGLRHPPPMAVGVSIVPSH